MSNKFSRFSRVCWTQKRTSSVTNKSLIVTQKAWKSQRLGLEHGGAKTNDFLSRTGTFTTIACEDFQGHEQTKHHYDALQCSWMSFALQLYVQEVHRQRRSCNYSSINFLLKSSAITEVLSFFFRKSKNIVSTVAFSMFLLFCLSYFAEEAACALTTAC